jgi:hypothetical protein
MKKAVYKTEIIDTAFSKSKFPFIDPAPDISERLDQLALLSGKNLLPIPIEAGR